MTYMNVQEIRGGVNAKGVRLSDGKIVTGELFMWTKYRPTARIVEPQHERISEGHQVDPFKIELVH